MIKDSKTQTQRNMNYKMEMQVRIRRAHLDTPNTVFGENFFNGGLVEYQTSK